MCTNFFLNQTEIAAARIHFKTTQKVFSGMDWCIFMLLHSVTVDNAMYFIRFDLFDF